jgi:hypothetical protein
LDEDDLLMAREFAINENASKLRVRVTPQESKLPAPEKSSLESNSAQI